MVRNELRAFVSSAEWFATKLLSSECFSHVQNGWGMEFRALESLLLLHTFEVVFFSSFYTTLVVREYSLLLCLFNV
jgi:hypothetical protein